MENLNRGVKTPLGEDTFPGSAPLETAWGGSWGVPREFISRGIRGLLL